MLFLPTTVEAVGSAMYHAHGSWLISGYRRAYKAALYRGMTASHRYAHLPTEGA